MSGGRGRHSAIRVGDVLGERFELVAEIGEGGMGRVYEATDLKHDRPAAVKVLARWLAEDFEFRHRFEREANAAQRVTHPHVLPVWDHGEQDGMLYLATPLCDTDLRTLLVDEGPMDCTRALTIVAQVAWALDWAHGRGVVHRDIKPENILLVVGPSEYHAYLADFGLAKAAADETLTQVGHPPGLSPGYAAPEQWQGEAVGPAADQYSLAATLFACVAGFPPFHPCRGPELRQAHLLKPAPMLHELVDGVPHAFAEAVCRGLAKAPAERFASCGELVAATRAGLSSPPPPPRVSAVPDTGAADAQTIVEEPPPAAAAPAPPTVAPEPQPSVAEPSERAIAQPEPSEPSREPAPSLGEPVGPMSEPLVVAAVPAAEPAASAPARPRARRNLAWLAVAVVVLAVVGGVIALVGGGGSGGGGTAGVALTVGRYPIDIAKADRQLWVANLRGKGTLSLVDPRASRVVDRAIPAIDQPFGVAIDRDRVWVVSADGRVVGLDARTRRRTVGPTTIDSEADGIAAAFNAVWTINTAAGHVARVPITATGLGKPKTIDVGNGPSDIAAGPDAIWVTNDGSGTLRRLDPTTGRPGPPIDMKGGPDSVAVGEGAVWVGLASAGRLLKVNGQTGTIIKTIRFRQRSVHADVAVGAGAVFYVSDAGKVWQIDPRSGEQIGQPAVVAGASSAAAVAGQALWVADPFTNKLIKHPFS